MDLFWSFLLDILILLGAALLLGAVSERLRLSAIVGYLLAGTFVGPHALGLIQHEEALHVIAELGVALLLFSIGLEFSWPRLRRLGPRALAAGVLQLSLTLIVAAACAMAVGVGVKAAIGIGAIVALSSTAVVLRTLASRAELDSIHGRQALGILLLQDVAVVPLVLLVTTLSGRGTPGEVAWSIGQQVVLAGLLVLGLVLFARFVMPRLITASSLVRNRELPILFAVVVAIGATWAAHQLGLSPALGAFVAGAVLGGSPVATQIRADVGPLRVLFVTLFFSSIGMLADLHWIAGHALLVGVVVTAVLAGNTAVMWLIGRMLGLTHRHALATGLVLAQVGEFSFVLAQVARGGPGQPGILTDDLFALLISVTIATLLVTPPLIAHAPQIGGAMERALLWLRLIRSVTPPVPAGRDGEAREGHVIVVGFGPAGRGVAEALRQIGQPLVVLELNPRTAQLAVDMGVPVELGDAAAHEVLEHLSVPAARAVVITVPDHRAAIQTIHRVRSMAPSVPVIARARYQQYVPELEAAGAHTIIDEEATVGRRLGLAARRVL